MPLNITKRCKVCARDLDITEFRVLRGSLMTSAVCKADEDALQAFKDSGATRRNTPVGSRGATSGDPAPERVQFEGQPSAEAKRTEKTADRGTHLERGREPQVRGAGSAARTTETEGAGLSSPQARGHTQPARHVPKPRKRTVGSISVPELPWKR